MSYGPVEHPGCEGMFQDSLLGHYCDACGEKWSGNWEEWRAMKRAAAAYPAQCPGCGGMGSHAYGCGCAE